MPNHKSAEKTLRKDAKRRLRNQSCLSAIKTMVKKARKDFSDLSLVQQAQKALDSAVSRGVLHHRSAARRVSRLMQSAHKSHSAS